MDDSEVRIRRAFGVLVMVEIACGTVFINERTVATMKMAYQHQNNPARHPVRALLFALLVILVALLVSAGSFLGVDALPQSDDSSVIMLVAQEAIDGEEVFNRVCSTCHTIDRPEDSEVEPLAPPMRMVVRRYLMATESSEEANARIIEWLKGPDAEKSLMPAMAIEHHGLMPPVVLTEDERIAVAEFVLTLADEAGQGMMNGEMEGKMDHQGMKQGEGQGMMNGEMEGKMDHQGMKQGEGQGMMKGRMQQQRKMMQDGQQGMQQGEGQGMMMRKKQNGDMNATMQQRMQMKSEGQMKGCNHDKGEGQMQGCKHDKGEGQMKGCKHNTDTSGNS